jgi:hypothetical protein
VKLRLIHFAGGKVAIEYEGQRAERVVDFVCRDIASADQEAAPQVTLRLLADDAHGQLLMYAGDTLLLRSQNEGTCAVHLQDHLSSHLADNSTGGLLFHAACLSWQGRGLVMPGETGAGKSVLSAWLIKQGFCYHTDELVFVPFEGAGLETFARPLSFKPTAWGVLKRLFDLGGLSDQIMSSPNADLVPPRLLGSLTPSSSSSLDCVLFPRYQPGAKFELSALSGAKAGLELARCLANGRNLPHHGIPDIARLARSTPAYGLSYSGFDQLGGSIQELLVASDGS